MAYHDYSVVTNFDMQKVIQFMFGEIFKEPLLPECVNNYRIASEFFKEEIFHHGFLSSIHEQVDSSLSKNQALIS